MEIELKEEERAAVRRALEVYLSDLREEIVKTEKLELRTELHAEEEVLERVIRRLA